MKILVLEWTMPVTLWGGTAIATHSFSRELVALGHEVLVVTTQCDGPVGCREEDGLCVRRIRGTGRLLTKYARYCVKSLAAAWQFRPTVVHAQSMWMALPAFMCRVALRVRYVVWLQGADVYNPRWFRGPLSALVLGKSALVLALTCDMQRRAMALGAKRIQVVGNGVDTSRFGFSKMTYARHALGLSPALSYCLFAGSLVPVKGVAYLIEAWRMVERECQDARLLIVGDGPDRDGLRSAVEQAGVGDSVCFAGRVPNPDVALYMAAADLFVLPSLSEGFPLVVLEAMASGLPVVVSNVTGLAEIVADGENGLLVPPTDVKRLAAAMVRLIESPEERDRIGRANREAAAARSWTAIAEALVHIYRAVGQGADAESNHV